MNNDELSSSWATRPIRERAPGGLFEPFSASLSGQSAVSLRASAEVWMIRA
jgi:hypothetical protein